MVTEAHCVWGCMWTCIERLCQKNTDVQFPSFLQPIHRLSVDWKFLTPTCPFCLQVSRIDSRLAHRSCANRIDKAAMSLDDGSTMNLPGCQLITERLDTFAVSFSNLPRMRQNDPTGAGGASSLSETGRSGRTCLEAFPSPSL